MATDLESIGAGPPALLGVLLLAAGRSRRMGRPKLLLPWRGSTILGYTVELWRSLGAEQIAVVGASGDQLMEKEMDRTGLSVDQRIVNPLPERGMFSSVQCAARWAGWRKDLARWTIVLGDQLHVRPETLRALLDFSTARPGVVCQPARHGRPRHPVVLPRSVFVSLAGALTPNLKDFLSPLPRALCELDDPGLDLDIDTPADHAAAMALDGRSSEISSSADE
jgi:CTP:molybdopterin cytidylyltransferase MocA